MHIGVPGEIKNREHRVAITPDGAAQLVAAGHRVMVEAGAGADSGFDDASYRAAGAVTAASAAEVWQQSELIVKVKEPLRQEYRYFRDDLTIFTYLHLAAVPELAEALVSSGVCAIGYETVQLADGSLPLLAPMSRVAGKVAAQLGLHYLQKENGSDYAGIGRLVGGIGSLQPARVLVLGAGNVGMNAAADLAALGADVQLLEADSSRIAALERETHERINVAHYTHGNLLERLPECDLMIGAALIPGEHAPLLLSADDIATMQSASVFIDVAIDQGGMSRTSRPTTFEAPVYLEQGVIHCCLPNLPAAVPQSSTAALTHATLPYIRRLADLGIERATAGDAALRRGINVRGGEIEHDAVRSALATDAGG